MKKVRLDRLLANLGYGSRRSVLGLFAAGKVSLDGSIVKSAVLAVASGPEISQRLRICGEPLDPPFGLILMMHKPLGVSCSHKEPGDLVYDLLPERWQMRKPPLSTIGRLDKETSGLLLLTDDGTLLHKITSPKSKLTKRYQVVLDRPLRGDESAIFASGTLLLEREEKPLLPAKLEVHTPTSATIWLHEGRYHQVRRMFAAVENHVIALHRDQIGSLTLPADLAAGQWRVLETFSNL